MNASDMHHIAQNHNLNSHSEFQSCQFGFHIKNNISFIQLIWYVDEKFGDAIRKLA